MFSDKKENKKEDNFFASTHDIIMSLNQSKIFAGLMIVIINVISKFATIRLGETVESYLNMFFNKNILVFAVCWMGTRDIYTAFLLTVVFIIIFDFLLNEKSCFCCITEGFKEEVSSAKKKRPSDDEIKNALEAVKKGMETLERSIN